MTIRTRLILGLLAIAVVLLVPLGLSLRSLQRVDADVSRLREDEINRLILLRRASEDLEQFARDVAIAAPSRSATGVSRSDPGAVDTMPLSAIAEILGEHPFDSVTFHYRDALTRYASGGDPTPAIVAARRWVSAAERDVAQNATVVVESAADETNRSREIAAAALGVAVLLAVAIGTWLTVSIGRPVAALKAGMLGVAEGDFAHPLRITPTRRDEFGTLAESFATMTARLSQLERMKAVWTSIVTHELKTPINVIMGNIQLGEEGILGELTPKQRNAFATMRRNATVLKRRVQRLLDVSQFEAGAGKIELSRIDLAEFLDGVEASFTVIGQERRIAFVLTRPDALPSEVVWDHDRMSEVLDNLLSNAFKFTPSGGAVELRVEAPGANVRFDVRDTGAGIPPGQLPHLFRRFYQADNQEKASAKGTGLGLAITKEIVEAHGGTIGVDSAVGGGTIFTVIVPAVVSTEHASARVRRLEAVSSSPSSTSSTPSQGSAPRP